MSKVVADKTLEDLRTELYNSHTANKTQIKALIESVSKLVKDTADASVLVPLISQYLGMYIKNDELLMKLINSIAKDTNSNAVEDSFLTEEEIQELTANFQESRAIS